MIEHSIAMDNVEKTAEYRLRIVKVEAVRFELRIPPLEQFEVFFATFGGHDLALTVEIEMSVITDTCAPEFLPNSALARRKPRVVKCSSRLALCRW